jgi:hypothetical protein
MNVTVQNLAEKLQMLSSEQIAEVENFVDFLRLRDGDHGLTRGSAEVSAPSFEAVWSNPEDDVYDAL